jgi:hypothetical protein
MEHDLLLDMRRMGIRNRVFASYEYMMMELFAKFGLEHIDYDSDKNLSKEEIDARSKHPSPHLSMLEAHAVFAQCSVLQLSSKDCVGLQPLRQDMVE